MVSRKKKILWVDDEIEFLRAHILFLEEHHYDVEKTTNGDDAIELIQERNFDLIFLDEQMPGKDGISTLKEIKRLKPGIPVVMVTKSEEEQLMEEAFGRNIDGYLTKPVNPSQILSVCKSLLHVNVFKKTHLTAEYVNDYTNFKTRLMRSESPQDWFLFYKALCMWDLYLPELKDHGLEITHENHKKEAAKKFSSYVERNYLKWHSQRQENQFLITKSMKRSVFPLLKKNRKTCMVVMTGFRMDQWLTIREFLEPLFNISESHGWAILPSERLYCRSSLFSGQTPLDISLNFPELWGKLKSEEEHRKYEKELLKTNLFSNGISNIDDPHVYYIRSIDDSQDILSEINNIRQEPLIVLVVEFAQLLMNLRKESKLMMEIAPDERGLRELTRIWFQASNLFKILSSFSKDDRSVVLTSDHGSILVRKPVEVFCQEEKSPHPRVKTGKDISCDERFVFFIESPSSCGLPGRNSEDSFAIAKEDKYFVYPNKYHYFGTGFEGQMVSGGISMEEILVPLITLETPAVEQK